MNVKQLVGTILGTIVKGVVVIVIAYFTYKAATIAYDYGYRVFAEGPVSPEPGYDVNIAITSDKDAKDIGELLASRGLIRDSKLFVLQELLSEHHGQIKEGVYTLNTSMTVREMLEIMAYEEPETETFSEITDSAETKEASSEPEETAEESSEETP